ncbi:MAG: hypothetical protein AAB544_02095 [Patescibacteria group bacterium]
MKASLPRSLDLQAARHLPAHGTSLESDGIVGVVKGTGSVA